MNNAEPELNQSHLTPLIWLCVLIVFVAGCAHTTVVKPQFSHLGSPAGTTRMPLSIALVLEPGVGNSTSQFGVNVYVFANAVDQYARNVCTQVFNKVTVYSDASQAINTADAILIPKVIKIQQSWPTEQWEDRKAKILVEWTLKDRENKDILWTGTVDGAADMPLGSVFMLKNEKILFQKLFDQLHTTTCFALLMSQEMRQLVK